MTGEQYIRFLEDIRRIGAILNRSHGGERCYEREGGEPQRPYPATDDVVSLLNDYSRMMHGETERVSNDL